MGVIINYMGNYALKQYLAEPRPMKREVQFEEFGMPSSHRYRTLMVPLAVSD